MKSVTKDIWGFIYHTHIFFQHMYKHLQKLKLKRSTAVNKNYETRIKDDSKKKINQDLANFFSYFCRNQMTSTKVTTNGPSICKSIYRLFHTYNVNIELYNTSHCLSWHVGSRDQVFYRRFLCWSGKIGQVRRRMLQQ